MDAMDVNDEEVTIETEHPEYLQNETPESIQTGFSLVIQFISAYGWLLLVAGVVLWWVKNKLEQSLERWQSQKKDDEYVDPDVAQVRYASMEASRRRMQEEHDAKMERWKEQQKIKEEEQRQQKIDDWENHKAGRGYKSKMKPSKKPGGNTPGQNGNPSDSGPVTSSTHPRARLRQNDYNPMFGPGGGSGGWRPSRPSSGGGG